MASETYFQKIFHIFPNNRRLMIISVFQLGLQLFHFLYFFAKIVYLILLYIFQNSFVYIVNDLNVVLATQKTSNLRCCYCTMYIGKIPQMGHP